MTPIFPNTAPGADLGFIHRFVPAADPRHASTLLLLHGTGGSENDLLALGADLHPEANLLSPRGKTLENGMARFFRRLAEGVFDEADLIARTHELADFVAAAARHYGFDAGRVTAVGYSNGANIAASLLLLRPETLRSAVLLRAMVPLQPAAAPDLAGKTVFLAAGKSDPLVPGENSQQLAQLLGRCGAEVTLHWSPAGHQLTAHELDEARRWLAGRDAR